MHDDDVISVISLPTFQTAFRAEPLASTFKQTSACICVIIAGKKDNNKICLLLRDWWSKRADNNNDIMTMLG